MSTHTVVSAELEWIGEFARERGRPPRVLHVGNIGNNAYLNARFLREAGLDCHVLAYDYYDKLAMPEWEGDRRPPWFAQGPLQTCARYLAALDAADGRRLDLLRRRLRVSRAVPPRLRYGLRRARIRAAQAVQHRRRAGASDAAGGRPVPASDAVAPDLAAPYVPAMPIWRELFGRYDLVQCYSTDPIWALLVGQHPYVAYEHGTLRAFGDGDDPLSRLTAEAYRRSDHTFVTNGDCLPYAERLEIPSFSPMIHPLDVDRHERDRSADAARIRTELDAGLLLFCPMRHDWEIKGTDRHIRALPQIRERCRERVVLALCRWGRDLGRSRALVRELGLDANVVWLERMNRDDLIAYFQAADAVLDQMTLPHLDATAPQALAAGVPVIGSYDPDSTAWMVSEPAPIVPAFDEAGIAAAVETVVKPGFRETFRVRARDWVHREHHPRRLVAEHCRVYQRLLEQ